MLQRATVTELIRRSANVEVEIVQRRDTPGSWSVEAIDTDGDGAIYQAIFVGPGSEIRAKEYAAFKYSV